RTKLGSPIAPSFNSSRTRACWGWWRHMKASISSTPAARHAPAMRSASAAVRANGFSHSTCLPAFAARIVHSACRLLGSAAETADVADCVEATEGGVAGAVVAVAFHGGDVVGAQHAFEAHLFVGTHAGQQVGFPGVVPGLLELLGRAAHVSEMDEENLVLAA